MRQHSNLAKDTAEKVVKDIRRATRKQYSAEKIRIVLEGLRGEDSIAELYRHGLRASEVCDLRWEQIDWNSATLHVRRVKSGNTSHICRGIEAARPNARKKALSANSTRCAEPGGPIQRTFHPQR
jgi:integrase